MAASWTCTCPESLLHCFRCKPQATLERQSSLLQLQRTAHAWNYVVKTLAQQLRPQLEATIKHNDDPADHKYSPDAKSAARRALKNKALAYLAALDDKQVIGHVLHRFNTATNMTDKIAALAALIDTEGNTPLLLESASVQAAALLRPFCIHRALLEKPSQTSKSLWY